jgi:hypothetical protein
VAKDAFAFQESFMRKPILLSTLAMLKAATIGEPLHSAGARWLQEARWL